MIIITNIIIKYTKQSLVGLVQFLKDKRES